jgi:GTPase
MLLALNKIDLIQRDKLLALAADLNARAKFDETYMISALKSDGIEALRAGIIARLPEGPWVYPDDQLADLPLRLMASEFTREQLFLKLYDELPYALMVETETWTEKPDGSVRIDQIVTVARETQRAIVLGKGGQQIRAVGAAARLELTRELGRPVHLFLLVKVRENWAEDPATYRSMGLDYKA